MNITRRSALALAGAALAAVAVAPAAVAAPSKAVRFTGVYDVSGWCYHQVTTDSATFRLWQRGTVGESFTADVFVGGRTVLGTVSTCDPDASTELVAAR